MAQLVERSPTQQPRSQSFLLYLLLAGVVAMAAAIAGRLTVRQPPSRLAILAALIGGLLMGYGAWLAFGCNVGAYFSCIASTSLHGWLWIAFALTGITLGGRLRPLFKLAN